MMERKKPAAGPHDGWFAKASRLELGASPREGWQILPGSGVVIVLYSSRKPIGVFDKDVFTDELVLHSSLAELVPGAALDLKACGARYQQGATKLQYVSTDVSGTLRIDSIGEGHMRGAFDLLASAPQLDVLGSGALAVSSTFAIDEKTS